MYTYFSSIHFLSLKTMPYIEYQLHNRIATIILNRPDKRNALNSEVVRELRAAFEQAAADSHAKVVVLKAAGNVFCAGADLDYLQQLQKNTFEENQQDSQQLAQLFETIYTLPKVVIACIQGHAIAGGCGLATVCDFSFSVPEAKFGYTEVKIGFIPAIVSYFVSRKIGEGKARELLMTGNLISAAEAQATHLINYLSPANQIETECLTFAQMLCEQNSGQSMAWTKKLLAEITSLPLSEAMQYAATANAEARATEDCKKGIAAFLEKKPILW